MEAQKKSARYGTTSHALFPGGFMYTSSRCLVGVNNDPSRGCVVRYVAMI